MIILLSGLALWGWISNSLIFASFSQNFIPMAPNTALMFMAAGAALLVYRYTAKSPLAKIFVFALVFLILSVCLLILIRSLSGKGVDVEWWFSFNPLLTHLTFFDSRTPIGRMSPVTAANFLLVASSLFLITGFGNKRRAKKAAAVLSVFVILFASVIMLSYLYGTPLLYGGSIIPVALTTGMAFFFLGIGLIVAVGTDVWPLSLFLGVSIRARLMRSFSPVIFLVILFYGWYDAVAYRHVGNAALTLATFAVLCSVFVNMLISEKSKVISREIEKAETDRRHAEDALRYSEAKYTAIVDSAFIGVFQSRPNGEVIFVNSTILNLLEYESKEDINAHGGASVLYKYPQNRENLIKIVREKGHVESFDQLFVTKTGKLVNISLNMRLQDDILSGTMIDITERKKAEEREKEFIKEKARAEVERARAEELRIAYEALKKLEVQLIQAEKLASIGQLSAGVAHELNSPLDGLLSLLRSYRNNTNEGSSEYRELTVMLDAAEYMASIVRQLVSFARESKGELVELHFNDIINKTLVFVSGLLTEKGIVIKKDLDPGLFKIRGDKNQLQQVVLNLVNNSCDASPRGSEVIIKTRNSEDGGSVIAEFIDNGIGIRQEDMSKLFDPFFTTKGPGKGVGLGLFVSQGIIKQHNADMAAESQWGHGTKVTITIPVAK
jgi:PAS domain S-box-containing protein